MPKIIINHKKHGNSVIVDVRKQLDLAEELARYKQVLWDMIELCEEDEYKQVLLYNFPELKEADK